jgi:hypothetical protein
VHGNVIIEPQTDFTASQIRRLKEFYNDFFDRPPVSNEVKPLGKETAQAFHELVDDLERIHAQTAQYPFLKTIAGRHKEVHPGAWILGALSLLFFIFYPYS